MPAVASFIIEPVWNQFSALLPASVDAHQLGCQRPQIPDRIVFDNLVQVRVFGCAYYRIADATQRPQRPRFVTVAMRGSTPTRSWCGAPGDRRCGLDPVLARTHHRRPART